MVRCSSFPPQDLGTIQVVRIGIERPIITDLPKLRIHQAIAVCRDWLRHTPTSTHHHILGIAVVAGFPRFEVPIATARGWRFGGPTDVVKLEARKAGIGRTAVNRPSLLRTWQAFPIAWAVGGALTEE